MWTEPYYINPSCNITNGGENGYVNPDGNGNVVLNTENIPILAAIDIPGSIPHGKPGGEAIRCLGGLPIIEKAFRPAQMWLEDHVTVGEEFPASTLSLTLEENLAAGRRVASRTSNTGTGFVIRCRRHKSGKTSYKVEGRLAGRTSFIPELGLADFHLIGHPKNQDIVIPDLTTGRWDRVEDDLMGFKKEMEHREERLRQDLPLLEGGVPIVPLAGDEGIDVEFDEEIIDSRIPENFTRLTRPFHYGYADNPFKGRADVTIDQIWGRHSTLHNQEDVGNQKSLKKYVAVWRFADPNPPEELEITDETLSKFDELQKAYYEEILQRFRERPIWIRPILAASTPERFTTELTDWKKKPIISLLCYLAVDGPFRNALIRRGYNPLAHSESRLYQTIDFRDKTCTPRNDIPEKTDLQSLIKQYTFQEPPSRVSRQFQLCDIDNDVVKSLINDGEVEKLPSRDSGWFKAGIIDQIRAVMQSSVQQMRLRALTSQNMKEKLEAINRIDDQN